MSDSRVLLELSQLIRNLLFDGLRGDDLVGANFPSANSISFDSPGDILDNGNNSPPPLSLYLYHLSPDAHLNNRPMIQVSPGRQEFPPLSLDLNYMITPTSNNTQDNLVTLGRVMQILAAVPILRANFLDSLLRPARPEVRIVFNPVSADDMTRIWSAFSRPYRLSVCYLVQPVSIDSARQPESGPPVAQSVVDVHQIVGSG